MTKKWIGLIFLYWVSFVFILLQTPGQSQNIQIPEQVKPDFFSVSSSGPKAAPLQAEIIKYGSVPGNA